MHLVGSVTRNVSRCVVTCTSNCIYVFRIFERIECIIYLCNNLKLTFVMGGGWKSVSCEAETRFLKQFKLSSVSKLLSNVIKRTSSKTSLVPL